MIKRKCRPTLQPCIKCRILARHRHGHSNEYCYKCYRASRDFGTMIPVYGMPGFSLDKALSKVYTIRGNVPKVGSPHGALSLPRVLIGKKVKLVLVNDE